MRRKTARPWLTVVEDDHSRVIAGYAVNLGAPSALTTALAFRQAIWRRPWPAWTRRSGSSSARPATSPCTARPGYRHSGAGRPAHSSRRCPAHWNSWTYCSSRWPRCGRSTRTGFHFQGLRYPDPVLAACVGESVIIRYDPRDMAEIRVFTGEEFLCRAICPELAGTTISLKDIAAARNDRRRGLTSGLRERASVVDRLLAACQEQPPPRGPGAPAAPAVPASPPLGLYRTE